MPSPIFCFLPATCLTWLCLISSIAAQEKQIVSCRFVAAEESTKPLIHVLSEGQEVEITALKTKVSKPIDCLAIDGRINFISKSSREPIASLTVPEKLKEAILVFTKNPNKKGIPWKILSFENSTENYPPGGARVINLTPSEMRLILGKKRKTLKPLESTPFERPVERDQLNMARATYQVKNRNEEWVPIQNTAYRFVPPRRFISLTFLDPKAKKPRIRTISDTPPLPVE